MGAYVNNKKLLDEIILSKELDELTPNALAMFQKMIKGCISVMRYKDNADKEDCMSEAMFDVLKYWRRFDPTRENPNPFAFFTQMIKNGIAKGFKKIHPVKTMNMVSIDIESGIYNI